MDKPVVRPEEIVDRGPIDATSLQGKVFQIPACVSEILGIPSLPKLHAATQIQVPHKWSSGGDELDKCIARYLLVKVTRIQDTPQLTVKAHLVPRLGYY